MQELYISPCYTYRVVKEQIGTKTFRIVVRKLDGSFVAIVKDVEEAKRMLNI